MIDERVLITVAGKYAAAQAFRQAQSDAAETGRAVGGLGDRMRATGEAASDLGGKLSLGVTAPLVGLGVAAISAASDMGESMSKVGVVFGALGDDVIEWSETTAEAMGIAQGDALEAAGTFGNLLTAMGLTTPQAKGMSLSMIQLAADMASFNNASPEETLLALRSGLAGESEPLKRFGVALRAADVEARAMSMGLADANGELSEGAKIQARYAIIMEQTASAQGDFARTSDGLANSQRIAAAQVKDMLAILGGELLPIAQSGVSVITDLVKAFRDMPPHVRSMIVSMGGVAAAAGPALAISGKLVSGIGGLMTAAQAAGGGLAGLSAALNTAQFQMLAVTGAAIALIGVYKTFTGVTSDVERGVEETGNAWDLMFTKQIESGADAREMLELYRQKQAEVKAELDRGGVAVDLLVRNQEALYTETGKLNLALVKTATGYSEYAATAREAGLSGSEIFTADHFQKLRDGETLIGNLTRATQELTSSTVDQAAAARLSEQAALDLALAQARELVPAAESSDQAMLNLAQQTAAGTVVTDRHKIALIEQYHAIKDAAAASDSLAEKAARVRHQQDLAASAAHAHRMELLDLRQTLVDAEPEQIATTELAKLRAEYEAGRLTAKEYDVAVVGIQQAFGLVTPESIALAQGMDILNTMFVRGDISAEELTEQIQILTEDAKDGELNVVKLAYAHETAAEAAWKQQDSLADLEGQSEATTRAEAGLETGTKRLKDTLIDTSAATHAGLIATVRFTDSVTGAQHVVEDHRQSVTELNDRLAATGEEAVELAEGFAALNRVHEEAVDSTWSVTTSMTELAASLEQAGGKSIALHTQVELLSGKLVDVTRDTWVINVDYSVAPMPDLTPGKGERPGAYQMGGRVDAPIGAAVPAILHGGEIVLNPYQTGAMGGPGGPTPNLWRQGDTYYVDRIMIDATDPEARAFIANLMGAQAS